LSLRKNRWAVARRPVARASKSFAQAVVHAEQTAEMPVRSTPIAARTDVPATGTGGSAACR
jgi:hypothetical protein